MSRDLPAPHLPTRDECEALGRRVLQLVTAPKAEVKIGGTVTSGIEFARGDTHVATEGNGVGFQLTVDMGEDRRASVAASRLDDVGLREAVREVEAAAREQRSPAAQEPFLGPQQYPEAPKTFFESVSAAMTTERRAALVHSALDAADASQLIGAGNASFSLSARAIVNTEGLFTYSTQTSGDFSLTVRTRDGTGSGWAWSGFEDWSRADVPAAIAYAVDIAKRSANPVAFEPGRYTVILEPAAVAELVATMVAMPTYYMSAMAADNGLTVYSKRPTGTNKIGLQMLDRRVGLVSDPWDPDLPMSVVDRDGAPIGKVVLFDHGILKNLQYDRAYARAKGREPVVTAGGVRLTVDDRAQSLDEMVASTKRGVWVNRLSGVSVMNGQTLLLTGTTRDGTFLIENGKITKPIKNFRFTDSPFFALNKLEAAGTPVRAPGGVVVPRLKVRDFEFTSLTDAV